MASNRNDLIIVGDSFVGKSSLINRMLKKSSDRRESATVGVAFRSLNFEYNFLKLKIALWDTSGFPTFKKVNALYCQHSVAAIVVSI
jgi:small GTP-binding protein